MRIRESLLIVLIACASTAASGAVPVTLDLARLPHDAEITVAAPSNSQFSLRLVNRAPLIAYDVTIGQSVVHVPPTPKPDKPLPAVIPGNLELPYSCESLRQYPLADLCRATAGTTCVTSESDVAATVGRIAAVIGDCSPSTRAAVASAVDKYTTYVVDGQFSGSVKVRIERAAPTASWNVEVTSCDPTAQITNFLERQHPSDAMKVVTYDAEENLWRGYAWNPNAGSEKRLLLLDDGSIFYRKRSGIPRMALSPKEPFSVLVTNINPLAYSARTTQITTANIEDLATLQQLASLFGDLLVSGAKVASYSDLPSHVSVSGDKMTFALQRVIATTPTLGQIATDLKEALETYLTPHAVGVKTVNTTAKRILQTAQQLDERFGAFTAFVQRVEDRVPDLAVPTDISTLPISAEDLSNDLRQLDTQRTSLRNNVPTCTSTIAAALELVQLRVRGVPEKAADRTDALNRYLTLLNDLTQESLDADSCNAQLQKPLTQLASWLTSNRLETALDEKDRPDLAQIAYLLSGTTSVLTKRTSTITEANDLLSRQALLGRAASTLNVLVTRMQPYLRLSDPCALKYGVIEIPRPQGRSTTIPWAEFDTETVKLTPDPTFKDRVQLKHAEVTSTLEIARLRRWEFDTDIALTYTNVVDPDFGLVAGKVDRTAEKSHAGDLGLFMTMKPKDRAFGAQFGLGLGGYPAAFLGGALQLGPWVKISAGGTAQRVKTLAGGQREGETSLASKEDIKTKDTFDNGWYLGLSITVDNLPFFKK